MLERSPDPRFRRTLVTPEGVDLRLVLAQASERATAFVIDVLAIVGFLVALTLLMIVAAIGVGRWAMQAIGILWLLGFFLLRLGYFTGFELGGRAATLGKRVIGLRVVARDGGPLTGGAIVTRNALRELELFLPLSFMAYQTAQGQAEAWTAVAGLVWTGAFALFPLFNRDRMRMGDLLAGTWVVHAPRRKLAPPVGVARADAGFVFTDAQLDAYGEFELQTLADVLRRDDADAMTIVAGTIRRRIGWSGRERDDAAFLHAYYAALCERLERGMLFGRRRRSKHQRAA